MRNPKSYRIGGDVGTWKNNNKKFYIVWYLQRIKAVGEYRYNEAMLKVQVKIPLFIATLRIGTHHTYKKCGIKL